MFFLSRTAKSGETRYPLQLKSGFFFAETFRSFVSQLH